ncbi:MAG: SRPBCC family protein [Acidimicrobiia bacterium]
MKRVEVSTVIGAGPERLWEFFSDTSRWSDWAAFTDEVLDHEPLGEGAVYRNRSHIGPIRQVSEWRITEWDPPRLQVHEGKAPPVNPVLTVTLEPVAEGTRLTQVAVFSMPRWLGPLGALLEKVPERMIRKGLEETQANLKRIMETENPEA